MGYCTAGTNTWNWVWFLKIWHKKKKQKFIVSSLNRYLSKIIIQVEKIIASETN